MLRLLDSCYTGFANGESVGSMMKSTVIVAQEIIPASATKTLWRLVAGVFLNSMLSGRSSDHLFETRCFAGRPWVLRPFYGESRRSFTLPFVKNGCYKLDDISSAGLLDSPCEQ